MTLELVQTLNPRVHFEVIGGTVNVKGPELERRLVKFEYLHDPKKHPKVLMEFDNSDGKIVNLAVLILGLKMRCDFGYDKLRSRALNVTVRKINGAMVRSPNTISPAPGACGIIKMEGALQSVKLERSPKKSAGTYRQMKVSQAVKLIAKKMGFSETKTFVEEGLAFGEPEPTVDVQTILEDDSLSHFLDEAAAHRGFDYYTSNGEFHWHSPDYEVPFPGGELEYFYGPDLLDIDIDGDFRTNISSIRARSHNVAKRLSWTYSPDNNWWGVGGSDSGWGKSLSRPGVTVDEVLRCLSGHEKEKGLRRLTSHARRRWSLKLTIVGDPRIYRGTSMNLGNFGPLIDGRWIVWGVRHTFDNSGYTTVMTLHASKGRRDRSRCLQTSWTYNPDTNTFGVARICFGTLGEKKKRKKRKSKRKAKQPSGKATRPSRKSRGKTR